MAAIATLWITEVVELNKASPYSSQKLISPNLIDKVDNSSSHFVKKFMHNTFLFLNQIFVQFFSGKEHNDKPDEIDDIDNDDWEELSEKVYVSVVKVKSDRAILDYIAHPLMLNSFSVRRQEKIEIFNETEASDGFSKSQRNVVCCNINMKEENLQS